MEKTEEPSSAVGEEVRSKRPRRGPAGWLRNHKVRDLVRNKRRLVEVPYTATLADTVNALVANGVAAAPVVAPPGQWIGAGGSMILESDRATGTVRKHYIGMVTMVDVLVHIAEEEGEEREMGTRGGVAEDVAPTSAVLDLDRKMGVPVSAVIGHSLEGLSLWTVNPNTCILDCMESFSKGVHRALVPLESQLDNIGVVELMEESPCYKMLTQMDVLHFLRVHDNELKDIISRGVGDLRAINENVFSVTKYTKVIEAIKSMKDFSLHAVPIVEAFENPENGETLEDGRGRKLVGTFSATDLRGCPIALLQSSLSTSIMEFIETVANRHGKNLSPRKLVTCNPESSLSEVIEAAVGNHAHRVWLVDELGLLRGVISLTDMLHVIRESALWLDKEMHEAVMHVS